uniref:Uncharacterized protein n=1 Tax=Moniliophthora roreri TaxID=221103 RepID=A0A0W0F8Z7_MONRR
MDDHPEPVSNSEHNASLPYIAPVIRQLDALSQEELESALSNDILRSPQTIEDRALAAAFALLVLLQYRDQRIHHRRDSLNPWDRWSQERDAEKELCAIDKHLERVWERFLDTYCSPKDIEGVLWTAFPLEEDRKKPIRGMSLIISFSHLAHM